MKNIVPKKLNAVLVFDTFALHAFPFDLHCSAVRTLINIAFLAIYYKRHDLHARRTNYCNAFWFHAHTASLTSAKPIILLSSGKSINVGQVGIAREKPY